MPKKADKKMSWWEYLTRRDPYRERYRRSLRGRQPEVIAPEQPSVAPDSNKLPNPWWWYVNPFRTEPAFPVASPPDTTEPVMTPPSVAPVRVPGNIPAPMGVNPGLTAAYRDATMTAPVYSVPPHGTVNEMGAVPGGNELGFVPDPTPVVPDSVPSPVPILRDPEPRPQPSAADILRATPQPSAADILRATVPQGGMRPVGTSHIPQVNLPVAPETLPPFTPVPAPAPLTGDVGVMHSALDDVVAPPMHPMNMPGVQNPLGVLQMMRNPRRNRMYDDALPTDVLYNYLRLGE